MSTIPFLTTIPISIIPPSTLIRLMEVPVNQSAMSTPLRANGIENMMNVSYQANIGRMQTELNNYTNYVNNMRNTAINTYNEEQEAFQASVTAYADEVRIINQSNNDLIGSFVELMPESRSGADVNTNVVDAIVEPIEFNTGSELSTAETTSFGDATSKLVYVMAGSGVCALVMLTWAAVDSFKKRKI